MADVRAALVDPSDTPPANTLTLTLPRRHVEEALAADEPIDLVLDVERRAADGDAGETSRVTAAWERGDLEDLLRRSGGDSVSMAFDAEALERMLDPEFEAHGMRETLAVLAVAVAAGGAASVATAQPAEYTGIGGSGVQQVSTAAPGADIEAVRSDAMQPAAPAAASGIEAVRSAEPLAAAESGSLASASGIEAVRSAEPLAAAESGSLASASGIEAVRSSESLAGSLDSTALASGAGIEAARSAEAASARVPAPSDGGIALSLPSPETTAALVGGFALLITGAAFVARSRRHELRLP